MEAKTATVITTVKHEVRLRELTAQIEAQQASVMTVQGWCAENGISPKTYYYRLRKVREQCIICTGNCAVDDAEADQGYPD